MLRPHPVLATLQQRRHLLGRLIAHLDTASIAEILVRLVGAEEQTGMYLPPSQVGFRAAGTCTGFTCIAADIPDFQPDHMPDALRTPALVVAC